MKLEMRADFVNIEFSKSEAIVLFEWISNNWEKHSWEGVVEFSNSAEFELISSLQACLERSLSEPFDPNYAEIIQKSYDEINKI